MESRQSGRRFIFQSGVLFQEGLSIDDFQSLKSHKKRFKGLPSVWWGLLDRLYYRNVEEGSLEIGYDSITAPLPLPPVRDAFPRLS